MFVPRVRVLKKLIERRRKRVQNKIDDSLNKNRSDCRKMMSEYKNNETYRNDIIYVHTLTKTGPFSVKNTFESRGQCTDKNIDDKTISNIMYTKRFNHLFTVTRVMCERNET